MLNFHVCWEWIENILLHSLASYKCKYIMTTEAAIDSCSNNNFPEEEHSFRASVKKVFCSARLEACSFLRKTSVSILRGIL